MAVRQYIGARYVPLYAGDWDSTRNYEPLTIVTDANGNSFTSLKDVPAGTALTDRSFWIQTSSFSGAVDVLSRRVSEAENDINDINESISAIIEKNVQQDSRIDNLESGGITLVIADSYGERFNSSNENISQVAARLSGRTVRHIAYGGAGFSGVNQQIANLLDSYSGDKSEITQIIFVCGANDCFSESTEALILAGMESAASKISAQYSNCKAVKVFAATTAFSTQITANNRKRMIMTYIRGCRDIGFVFVLNSQWCMYDSTLMESDRVHPNASGVDCIGGFLSQALTESSIDVEWTKNIADILTLNSEVSAGFRAGKLTFRNGIITLDGAAAFSFIYYVDFTNPQAVQSLSQATTALVIGTFSVRFGDMVYGDNYGWKYSNSSIKRANGNELGTVGFSIQDGNLTIVIATSGNTSLGNVTGFRYFDGNISAQVW